jgi:hypothetical protein
MGRFRKHGKAPCFGRKEMNGYEYKGVSHKSIKKRIWLAHRLVLLSFRGLPPENKQLVDHFDSARDNNELSNLSYVSASENCSKAIRKRQFNTGNYKPVFSKGMGDVDWTWHNSQASAAEHRGVHKDNVSHVLRGRYKHTGNIQFKWDIEDVRLHGEEWASCWDDTGYDAMVSSFGRFKDTKGVIKTPIAHNGGYCRVELGGKQFAVHRLVASAFNLPRLPTQDFVDHINSIRNDNRLSNLRWVTRQENNILATRKRLESSVAQDRRRVYCMAPENSKWVQFHSLECATASLEDIGITSHIILCSANTGTATPTGHTFMWEDEYCAMQGEVWTALVLPLCDFDPELD